MFPSIFSKFARNVRLFSWKPVDAVRRTKVSSNVIRNYDTRHVLGLYETGTGDPILTPTAENIKRSEVKIMELIRKTGLRGELGSSMVFNYIEKEFGTIAVVGLGKENAGFNKLNIRVATGINVRSLDDEGCKVINIEAMDCITAVAKKSHLTVSRYQGFKSIEDWKPTACDCLCPYLVIVEIRSSVWIKAKKMTALMSVSDSSCVPPCFVGINYYVGEMNDAPILLVGEELAFNSGGACLKKPSALSQFKESMAGAEVEIATIFENISSEKLFKPGDILITLNGKSYKIKNILIIQIPKFIFIKNIVQYENKKKSVKEKIKKKK